jgi:transcription elongation GreA/GreB family factor
MEVELVGSPTEVDLQNLKISTACPLGQALLHRRVGDEITVEAPSGEARFVVVAVRSVERGGEGQTEAEEGNGAGPKS